MYSSILIGSLLASASESEKSLHIGSLLASASESDIKSNEFKITSRIILTLIIKNIFHISSDSKLYLQPVEMSGSENIFNLTFIFPESATYSFMEFPKTFRVLEIHPKVC